METIKKIFFCAWKYKLIKISVFIMSIFTLLNLIPVKFAVKQEKYILGKDEYFIQPALKSGFEENWILFTELPFNYTDGIYVKIDGNLPFDILNSKDFSLKGKENEFIVKGKIYCYREEGEGYKYKFGVLEIESWDIVYPIKRSSFRDGLFVNYLTIFDLNWEAIIDGWLK